MSDKILHWIPAHRHELTRMLIKEIIMRTNVGSSKFKAIDLFAGPGGLSLGLTAAGFEVVAAVELDPDAGKTYRNNIGNHTEIQDITKFKPKTLHQKLIDSNVLKEDEKISLIAGGPPCPGFSLIGRSKISDLIKNKKGTYKNNKEWRHRFIDDPRNNLFLEFVKYVKQFKPDYFIMENVSGMTSYQIEADPVVEVIKKKFTGYNVEEKVLSAADFGVPQDRKRIIFIGTKKGLRKCEFPVPNHETKRLNALDAIQDLIEVAPTRNGIAEVKYKNSNSKGALFRKQMRDWICHRPNGELIDGKSPHKTCHWTRKVNDRDKVIFPFIRSGSPSISRGSIRFPHSHPKQIYGDIYPGQWSSVLVPSFKKAKLKTSTVDERHYVENRKGTKWVMYPSKNFKDKMRRIRWNEPAPTVVAHLAKDGYMFIHPFHDRTITVREAARFQSFPDSFEFSGSMTSQFRQVGNAVPPLLAKRLGEAVIDSIKQNKTLT